MLLDTASVSRAQVRRHPERGTLERELIHRILDEGLVAHVGFVVDRQPYVIPMAYGRSGDELILHGAVASRLLTSLVGGIDACVTVTLLDGLVLARAAFSHSMNYRSVVCFGRAVPIADEAGKRRALDVLVEHLVPGRSGDARPPDGGELDATAVLSFAITEASAKIRTGPPRDRPADADAAIWAGVIPLILMPGRPRPVPDLASGVRTPFYVARYRR